MKKFEELGCSPAPWSAKQYSGYDRESGDFNTNDAVSDATGKVIADWGNGETYGELYPNAEADAWLISAAPELYKWLAYAVEQIKCETRSCNNCPNGKCWIVDATAALAKAAGGDDGGKIKPEEDANE